MRKLVINFVKLVIAILAVDIVGVPLMEQFIDRSNPDENQSLVAILNIVDELSSTAHDFVNKIVEGMSAAEFINYLVIVIVIVFFIICIFDRCNRKTKVLLIDEPS